MTGKAPSGDAQQPRGNREGARDTGERGYQPQASGPVDPAQVKPPHGDTAIVPPQKPASKP